MLTFTWITVYFILLKQFRAASSCCEYQWAPYMINNTEVCHWNACGSTAMTSAMTSDGGVWLSDNWVSTLNKTCGVGAASLRRTQWHGPALHLYISLCLSRSTFSICLSLFYTVYHMTSILMCPLSLKANRCTSNRNSSQIYEVDSSSAVGKEKSQ